MWCQSKDCHLRISSLCRQQWPFSVKQNQFLDNLMYVKATTIAAILSPFIRGILCFGWNILLKLITLYLLSKHCTTKPTISSSITQYFAIPVPSLEHSADTHITGTIHGFMVDKSPAISYNRRKTEAFDKMVLKRGVTREFVGVYVQQQTHLVHSSESNWKIKQAAWCHWEEWVTSWVEWSEWVEFLNDAGHKCLETSGRLEQQASIQL